MGCGVAEVFRIADRFVLVEGFGEYLEDELFLEWLASPLAKGTKSIATVGLATKTLALLPATDYATKAKRLAKHTIAKFGDENAGRVIGIGATGVTFALERPTKSSWGEASRCVIAPS